MKLKLKVAGILSELSQDLLLKFYLFFVCLKFLIKVGIGATHGLNLLYAPFDLVLNKALCMIELHHQILVSFAFCGLLNIPELDCVSPLDFF